ncbi:kinase-like protein [Aspergillus coremiiformis]|uniref:Kinase-like protein n=1 Tax=Aspergillus coremiiformis TaxID=138285 RepID=A0A5N6ZBB2_9EURO|nr:kinase-like protein [Aspergillus coremiiformis]
MAVPLPYHREPDELPAPLPSQHEIETATDALPTIRNPDYGGRIVLIRNVYVVKYGPYMTENEGHALLLLEHSLSIPAPRLYAMYKHEKQLYMVMQYMPGVELEHAWPSLTAEEKDSLLRQLRSIFQEIRSLSPGKTCYGNIAGGPVPHRYFLTPETNPAINGPFETDDDFHAALSLRSHQNWADNQRHGWTSDFFARHLPSALRGHRLTLTHGDLYRRNILVQKVSDPVSNTHTYRVTAIVDWETAGWYPEYWEYASSFALFQWIDDWPESMEKVLDPCPLEAALLNMVHKDLEF